jgi:hypothetical protein
MSRAELELLPRSKGTGSLIVRWVPVLVWLADHRFRPIPLGRQEKDGKSRSRLFPFSDQKQLRRGLDRRPLACRGASVRSVPAERSLGGVCSGALEPSARGHAARVDPGVYESKRSTLPPVCRVYWLIRGSATMMTTRQEFSEGACSAAALNALHRPRPDTEHLWAAQQRRRRTWFAPRWATSRPNVHEPVSVCARFGTTWPAMHKDRRKGNARRRSLARLLGRFEDSSRNRFRDDCE